MFLTWIVNKKKFTNLSKRILFVDLTFPDAHLCERVSKVRSTSTSIIFRQKRILLH